MKLLIVEDDPRAAKALERAFSEHGFNVELALDGEVGLLLAKAGEFDCLVLDVMLPGMDGFTVLTELRAAGSLTPVIFLTARDTLSDRIRRLELGWRLSRQTLLILRTAPEGPQPAWPGT